MTPCNLTIPIGPGSHILASVGIMPESESLLWKGGVPEDDGNRGEHNEVGEAMVGSSSMDMDPSPSRYIPTTSVAAMMI